MVDDASSLEGDAMGHGDRRKCKCCLKLFRPDPRNRRHQFYCSAFGCRAVSKSASQARWLAKPENQSYFSGPVNVARVQAWRARHPGYWRKGRCAGVALQDDIVRTTGRLLRLGQDILATSAAPAATLVPDCGAGRDRLRDVLQNPRLP